MKTGKHSRNLLITTDRREYTRGMKWVDPWDDSCHFLINTARRGFVGYYKRKGLYPYQRRSYRTWKHNRKTQWKD